MYQTLKHLVRYQKTRSGVLLDHNAVKLCIQQNIDVYAIFGSAEPTCKYELRAI